MRVKVPAKTVEVCDICGRQTTILEKCIVCKKDYCVVCVAYLPGCYIAPDVCKKCDDRPDVVKAVARYSAAFAKLYKLRDLALKKLKKL